MLKKRLLMHISSTSAAAGRRTFLLRARNLLLTAIRGDRGTETKIADFPKGENLADFNVICTNDGTRRMVGRNNFNQLNFAVPFEAPFVGREMGEEHRPPTTHVYTNFLSSNICYALKIWNKC